jgi:hypothetical protein
MNPRVKAVVPTDDYRLRLTFANGQIGEFDCSHLLNFGVFREFKETAYFMRASVAHGTVVWPNEQDICPDTLYEDSVKLTFHSAEQTHTPEPAVGPVSAGESSPPAR